MATQALLGKTPKAVVHEHFQKQGSANLVRWEIQAGPPPPADPCYTCVLTIPGGAATAAAAQADKKLFTGTARTKKGAEHAAATLALQYLFPGQTFSSAATAQAALPSGSQHENQDAKRLRLDGAQIPEVGATALGGNVMAIQSNGGAASQAQQAGGVSLSRIPRPAEHEANEELREFVENLQPEDMKHLLYKAQARITQLEDEVEKLETWRRQVRNLVGNDN